MTPRAAHEDKTYKVVEPVSIGADMMLPAGSYPGRLQWTEFAQRNGPPAIKSKRYVLPLSAEQVKAFGGKTLRSRSSLEVDVSKLVANGLITL